jgi:hypothetical protein
MWGAHSTKATAAELLPVYVRIVLYTPHNEIQYVPASSRSSAGDPQYLDATVYLDSVSEHLMNKPPVFGLTVMRMGFFRLHLHLLLRGDVVVIGKVGIGIERALYGVVVSIA